ncbi:uncharacterized protein METZ01_LOCUS457542, partial [marine metagenome]
PTPTGRRPTPRRCRGTSGYSPGRRSSTWVGASSRASGCWSP